MRIGHGFDAHRLVEGRSSSWAAFAYRFERGALGHSDGDVLAHALADALLGAAALGDLGARFPCERSALEGCQLDGTARAAAPRRCATPAIAIVNVDATIVVERPKLAPHHRAGCAKTSRCGSEIDRSRIGVKAKTSEGMGYTGDGTGIAVLRGGSARAGAGVNLGRDRRG